jgi:hypothetical protein
MNMGRWALAATPLALLLAQPAMAGGADDRAAIVNLIARYGEVHDFGTPEEYADQFTADAEIVVAGRVVAKGRDALLTQARRDHERFGIVLPDGTKTSLMRHLISNAVVERLDGNHASGSSYVTTIVRDGEEGPKILSVGRYLDTLERVGGQWKIARRTIMLDFGNAELGRKFGFGK